MSAKYLGREVLKDGELLGFTSFPHGFSCNHEGDIRGRVICYEDFWGMRMRDEVKPSCDNYISSSLFSNFLNSTILYFIPHNSTFLVYMGLFTLLIGKG